MVKYNYIWYWNDKIKKLAIVTIAYDENGAYEFAIQSPKDNQNMKLGRLIAKNRYDKYRDNIFLAKSGNWYDVKDHFDRMRLRKEHKVFNISDNIYFSQKLSSPYEKAKMGY